VLLAPETFDQNEEDGKVVVLAPEPPEGERDAVRQAELTCPAAAIRLT
jgi:ferredoxin